ncbi:MAG TPA: SDR family oxidoreductase [Xanthobacteraceae bacterium]|jgi:NAD(P)-dependent dehydrogenase (short-subunit alcohol dehydrogenase family)|nr:SDR family oxidoreductase [Xanthobacteraceae bacterium]
MVGTLDGKVAIVTGAGRGLGRVMTLGLLAAGACVAGVELDEPVLEETQQLAEDAGASERFLGIVADVTWNESGPKIVRACAERFSRLDVLINNAGVSTGTLRGEGRPVGKLWEAAPEEFRRVIEVNVIAPFLMTRAALPTLIAQHWGRIINVTTSLDTMWRSFMQPYGGSKAANEAHLLAMAQELDGTGVTANVLVPGGAADTRLVSRAAAPDRSKLISPDVMVAPLLWLCSNASDGVTGQRFIGASWDKSLPPQEAAQKAGAPMAWQQLGRQAALPDGMQ